MDDLQNQDLIDDKAMADISGVVAAPVAEPVVEEPAPLAPPPAPVVEEPAPLIAPPAAPAENPEVAPAPIPAPIAAPVVDETPVAVKAVPSVHDLGLLDDDNAADDKPEAEEVSPVAMPSSLSLNGDAPASLEDTELTALKKQALEQLSPLLGNLDLPPEQKFDTYMEVLRASDNKELVKPAFDAAQSITDEDKKAQALLDIVNEVNYLTQDHKDDA